MPIWQRLNGAASRPRGETCSIRTRWSETASRRSCSRGESADDHPLLRDGIAPLVSGESDMRVVAECSNGLQAILEFRAHRPDVTLMDLQMPEMNGLDAIMAICGEFPDARIIVLTTYAADVQALRALQAGARAYLLKNLVYIELIETIRAVYKGKKTLSPQVLRFRTWRQIAVRYPLFARTAKGVSTARFPLTRKSHGADSSGASPTSRVSYLR